MCQFVYEYLHHSAEELAKAPWSNAFVINNVLGITIEPKESISSQLSDL